MTKPTKKRKVSPSHAKCGTIACAHDPKTASPEAKRPPKTTSATSEMAAVRTTGHTTLMRLVAATVRPSSGSPRTAARGQEARPATTERKPLASVRAVVSTTTPSMTEMTVSHSAARSTEKEARPPQSSSRRTCGPRPASGQRSPKSESTTGLGAPTGTPAYAVGRPSEPGPPGAPAGVGPAAAGMGAGTVGSSVSGATAGAVASVVTVEIVGSEGTFARPSVADGDVRAGVRGRTARSRAPCTPSGGETAEIDPP